MHWSIYFQHLEKIARHYFLVATIAFVIFYLVFRKWIGYKKIQQRFPKWKDYVRELIYSMITMCIFAGVVLVMLNVPAITKHTFFYRDIHQYGWVWFACAFPVMFVMHDAYFYWTHRLMHHKKVFKLFHLVHHQSMNPSPWTAYSFHPLEALVEAGIFIVFLYTIPLHPLHILIFFFAMIVYNVYGHLGYELYPKGFSRSWVGKWINTSVNHNQHHQYFKGNYGLYFTWWDRWMGTIRSDYDEKFDEVTFRKKPTEKQLAIN